MKQVLSLGLVAGVAFLLGHFLRAPLPHVGAEGDGAGAADGNCAILVGDVNGSGVVDLSDAVYTLNFLFLGGPKPVDLCVLHAPLPATGQTMCYNADGNPIECSNNCCAEVLYPAQDAFYKAGCPMEGRFVIHDSGTLVDESDDTVIDTCTGLEWQKDTADVSGNGSVGDEDRLIWHDALQYCENLDFAGHTDWRLPNVRELQSIVDYGRLNPAIGLVFGALSDWYWSSSSSVGYPGYAWVVYFGGGHVGDNGGVKGGHSFVRAVRNAP